MIDSPNTIGFSVHPGTGDALRTASSRADTTASLPVLPVEQPAAVGASLRRGRAAGPQGLRAANAVAPAARRAAGGPARGEGVGASRQAAGGTGSRGKGSAASTAGATKATKRKDAPADRPSRRKAAADGRGGARSKGRAAGNAADRAGGRAGARAGAKRFSAKDEASRIEGRRSACSARADVTRRFAGSLTYERDHPLVYTIYGLMTGPSRALVLLVIAAFFAIGIYLPVRDLYIAHRTEDILAQQVAIRERYNKSLGTEVDTYLSQEGIEDAARKDLGMALPGEKTITVTGLDEDGNPIVKETGSDDAQNGADAGTAAGGSADGAKGGGEGASAEGDGSGKPGTATGDDAADADADEDSGMLKGADATDKNKTGSAASKQHDADGEPSTSAEVEAAERAVFENSPWYVKMLDALFFFDGSGGMAVISTGEQS